MEPLSPHGTHSKAAHGPPAGNPSWSSQQDKDRTGGARRRGGGWGVGLTISASPGIGPGNPVQCLLNTGTLNTFFPKFLTRTLQRRQCRVPAGQVRGWMPRSGHECPGSRGKGALDQSPAPWTRDVCSRHAAPTQPPLLRAQATPLASLPLPRGTRSS